ncbi:MAG: pilin [bacterium]|nr:pilin [bacterium]
MSKTDKPTPSASLQGPSSFLAVHVRTTRSLLSPRLASRAVLSLLSVIAFYILTTAVAHAQSTGLENPLNSNFSTIPAFIAGALKVLVIVALPVIALFIVYSGFLFIFARGDPTKLTKAKENFVYVIIGALLILGAWVIATLIGGTVTQLVGN